MYKRQTAAGCRGVVFAGVLSAVTLSGFVWCFSAFGGVFCFGCVVSGVRGVDVVRVAEPLNVERVRRWGC